MTDINEVTISGRLDNEARENDVGESHVTETDLTFTLPGKDDTTRDAWIQLQEWNGDQLTKLCSSGVSPIVIVKGSLNRRAWKDKNTDEWQHRYSITVKSISELDGQESLDKGGNDEETIPFG